MDGVVLDESKKRRLPLWMLGVSGADQVKKSRKGDVNDVVDKIGKAENAPECKAKKSRARRSAKCDHQVGDPCEDVLHGEESNVVVKRNRVATKRKAVRNDGVSSSSDVEEAVIEKKSKRNVGGKDVQKSVTRRGDKRKSKGSESKEDIEDEGKKVESSEDIKAALPNEDDEDLTMDDLISFANEFVMDEKDRGQQKKSDAEQIVHKQSVSRKREKRKSKGFKSWEDIEGESRNTESREYVEAASVNEDDEDLIMDDLMSIANEFVKDEEARGQQKKSDAEQILHKQFAPTDISRDKPADSVIASETVKRVSAHEEPASCHNASSTGDPAQDMLDLLLGPLLTQPLKEEKVGIITNEMITAYELKKQNQKLDSINAAIPLARKKTSLKDKVAMLLD